MFTLCENAVRAGFGCREGAKQPLTIAIVGVEGVGKTTILQAIQRQSVDDVAPTIGFSTTNIKFSGRKLTVYDLGGGPKIREIWARYYAEVHGIVFVVDASSAERVRAAAPVIREVANHEFVLGKPILVFANKSDVAGAQSAKDVFDSLRLGMIGDHEDGCEFHVQECSGKTQGKNLSCDPRLVAGMRWFLGAIQKQLPNMLDRMQNNMAKHRDMEAKERKEKQDRIRARKETKEREAKDKETEQQREQNTANVASNTIVVSKVVTPSRAEAEQEKMERQQSHDPNFIASALSPVAADKARTSSDTTSPAITPVIRKRSHVIEDSPDHTGRKSPKHIPSLDEVEDVNNSLLASGSPSTSPVKPRKSGTADEKPAVAGRTDKTWVGVAVEAATTTSTTMDETGEKDSVETKTIAAVAETVAVAPAPGKHKRFQNKIAPMPLASIEAETAVGPVAIQAAAAAAADEHTKPRKSLGTLSDIASTDSRKPSQDSGKTLSHVGKPSQGQPSALDGPQEQPRSSPKARKSLGILPPDAFLPAGEPARAEPARRSVPLLPAAEVAVAASLDKAIPAAQTAAQTAAVKSKAVDLSGPKSDEQLAEVAMNSLAKFLESKMVPEKTGFEWQAMIRCVREGWSEAKKQSHTAKVTVEKVAARVHVGWANAVHEVWDVDAYGAEPANLTTTDSDTDSDGRWAEALFTKPGGFDIFSLRYKRALEPFEQQSQSQKQKYRVIAEILVDELRREQADTTIAVKRKDKEVFEALAKLNLIAASA